MAGLASPSIAIIGAHCFSSIYAKSESEGASACSVAKGKKAERAKNALDKWGQPGYDVVLARRIRLVAKDAALSRRRSRVRFPYALPNTHFEPSQARSEAAWDGSVFGVYPSVQQRRLRNPGAYPSPATLPSRGRCSRLFSLLT